MALVALQPKQPGRVHWAEPLLGLGPCSRCLRMPESEPELKFNVWFLFGRHTWVYGSPQRAKSQPHCHFYRRKQDKREVIKLW